MNCPGAQSLVLHGWHPLEQEFLFLQKPTGQFVQKYHTLPSFLFSVIVQPVALDPAVPELTVQTKRWYEY